MVDAVTNKPRCKVTEAHLSNVGFRPGKIFGARHWVHEPSERIAPIGLWGVELLNYLLDEPWCTTLANPTRDVSSLAGVNLPFASNAVAVAFVVAWGRG